MVGLIGVAMVALIISSEPWHLQLRIHDHTMFETEPFSPAADATIAQIGELVLKVGK